jgi:essential nuclear protein 1
MTQEKVGKKSALKRHDISLEQQLIRDSRAVPKLKKGVQSKIAYKSLDTGDIESEHDEDMHMESQELTGKILKEAKMQREEIEEEEEKERSRQAKSLANRSKVFNSEESDTWSSESEEGISDKDRMLFLKWSQVDPKRGDCLADSLLQEFQKTIQEDQDQMEPNVVKRDIAVKEPIIRDIHPKIEEMYKKLGILLSKYKSGKLPKPFKVITALKNWHQVLLLTRPYQWTPHAVHQATRLFTSTAKPGMLQLFLEHILLPHVRISIHTSKKIHPHLFMALKKALYKPASFFKGILFPICFTGNSAIVSAADMSDSSRVMQEHRNEDTITATLASCMNQAMEQVDLHTSCTLREAVLFGTILIKMSIPMLHSAAALMKLVTIPENLSKERSIPHSILFQRIYSGVRCIFMRILIDKKYTLPYRVLEALIDYFCCFEMFSPSIRMTILWYQALLSFVQRYKHEFDTDQRNRLCILVQEKHYHTILSPEILRELAASDQMKS